MVISREVYEDLQKANAAAETSRRPLTDHDLIEHNMTNHAPIHADVIDRFETLRRAAKLFAHQIVDVCPDGRERSIALTDVERALMFAIASIARNQ